jgi:hypothetical protein
MKRQRPTADQMRTLAMENAKWSRALREWPAAVRPSLSPDVTNAPTRVWRSRDFLVQQFEAVGRPVRLTITRTTLRADGEWMDEITWDDLQRLKAEAGYGERFAVEAYPEDRHVVNVANLRHLWLVDRPEWAWRNDERDALA